MLTSGSTRRTFLLAAPPRAGLLSPHPPYSPSGRPSSAVSTGSAIELTEHNRKSPQSPRPFARTLALFVSTAAGVGYAPVAPGSFGSAAAIPIFVLLSRLDPLLYSLTVVALVFLGIWAADMTEAIFGREDDGRIVIDEVVGQLIALAPLVVLGASRKSALIVTGFVAFRLFDIWKPGPVGRAERGFRGGAGVVLDDVVAGFLAAIVVAALALGSGL